MEHLEVAGAGLAVDDAHQQEEQGLTKPIMAELARAAMISASSYPRRLFRRMIAEANAVTPRV